MPLYDYIYNTMDKSSDTLYEKSLKNKEKEVDEFHLTNLTSLKSIYHIRPGFAEYASKPYTSKWYLRIMWPVSLLSMVLTLVYGSSFTVERNVMKKLRMQSWAIPIYSFYVRIVFNSQELLYIVSKLITIVLLLQYGFNREKQAINNMIEKAIPEADKKGAKVVSLGLLNQATRFFHYSKCTS